jgi:DNA (cytosine-5)-methyltransferase 1
MLRRIVERENTSKDTVVRAIDLYAGIGGWSLGLGLAGIEVIRSYDWWQPAIDTHNRNHGGKAFATDIRTLDLDTLPQDISLVVGSPPCTQFSYANRGGNGDLADGLKDLVRFFEIVERLQPKYWVMENVPRVADVLRHAFTDPDHPLYRFRHLDPTITVLDLSHYGTPQARRRCIAGILPFELLESYRARLTKRTLGEVVSALSAQSVVDPVWGVELDHGSLTEMEREPPLGAEELRMNREAKLYHPVYNNMSFPDDPTAPSRTVTATCTRVSRESIVIEDPAMPGTYRRLTIRERGCLQGFPITYQFFGRSFAEKAKMIGNAIPPPFTYLVAAAAKGILAEDLRPHHDVGRRLSVPPELPKITRPNEEGRTYPQGRSFRAALPGLRFKSGMRFELANHRAESKTSWRVRFFHGPSSDIREVELDLALHNEVRASAFIRNAFTALTLRFRDVEELLARTNPDALQKAWNRRGDGPKPFELGDALGALAEELTELLISAPNDVQQAAIDFVLEVTSDGVSRDHMKARKLIANGLAILSGFVVGSWFNTIEWHGRSGRARIDEAA